MSYRLLCALAWVTVQVLRYALHYSYKFMHYITDVHQAFDPLLRLEDV